jgi:hypothetical protein
MRKGKPQSEKIRNTVCNHLNSIDSSMFNLNSFWVLAISMNILITTLSIAIVFALCYAGLRKWRQKKEAVEKDLHRGFRPRIGFSRLDGMESLSLLLGNGFHKHIWAEEIEIFLADLVADNQTSEPTLHGTQKILQMVAPRDVLPISLAEVIYKAAGEPQRKHSSVLSSVLRYRVGEVWFEKQLDHYRIQMLGLTASGVRRDRKPVQKIPIPEKSRAVAAVGAK